MNCVHDAFKAHADALGVATPHSFEFYQGFKRQVGLTLNEYTWTGIVPFLFRHLALHYPLFVSAIEYSIWMPEHYAADAPTEIARRIVSKPHWQWGERVDRITLAPAVYALYLGQHAVFTLEPPAGDMITLAIQLQRM